MSTLPILKQNAYLSIFVKDNHIFANLAYTDFLAQKTYMLSDVTDLSPLKFRMDDIVFNKKFWFEYFDSLEKVFDWDIVDRRWDGIFKIVDFQSEGVGVSGLKVLVDDNQPFFNKIYLSLKDFSKDISLRIVDDKYMKGLIEGLRERLEYEDILWIDLDLSHFTVYRSKFKTVSTGIFGKEKRVGLDFSTSKISWNSEIGLIDSIKNSRLQAFLSVESSAEEVTDRWANFVANTPDFISDSIVDDVLRSYVTIQNLSIKESNREKLNGFGRVGSAVFVTGKLAKLLKKRDLLLSIIDGFELDGIFDLYIDRENRVICYGKNLIKASESEDIVVIKGDVLPKAFKVVIPEVPSRAKGKIVFTGRMLSQEFEQKEIYALNPNLEIFNIPNGRSKVVFEGALKNGTVLTHFPNTEISFISNHGGVLYESFVVDCRIRPVIYGPKAKDNKIKLQNWSNGNKE